jgi:hypothetical protein
MLTAIKYMIGGEGVYQVNENANESEIRAHITDPEFFRMNTPSGPGTYTFYRGCVIVSLPIYGDGWDEQHHMLYVVCCERGTYLYVSEGDKGEKDMKIAKRCIDEILEIGIIRP